jgi:hypothetical protein
VFGLVWFGFIFDEKQGKQESLNHYRIISNVVDKMPYWNSHTTTTR